MYNIYPTYSTSTCLYHMMNTIIMNTIAERNKSTYNLLQLHKQHQLDTSIMRLQYDSPRRRYIQWCLGEDFMSRYDIVNDYLDHVRTNNYTGTPTQYSKLWMQQAIDGLRCVNQA